jgi:lysophospholipase L1-like esterase
VILDPPTLVGSIRKNALVPLLLGLAFDAALARDARAADPVCPLLAENKIVFMGSSVCFGETASPVGETLSFYQSYGTALRGYVFNYAVNLNARFKQGLGADWDVSNISVGGNSTPNVLARWDKDLLPQCGRYVVYGLSLANEGIIDNPGAFDQFTTNMAKLIQDARDNGMVPLSVNNYANNDYTPALYAKIETMNLLIHQWDVPTINVMGAIDDGAGHWAPGHFTNAGHPNDQGYKEMAASFVPSLFDALQAGRARPQKQGTTFVTLKAGQSIGLKPEEGLHSFTLLADVRTATAGPLLEYEDGAATGALSIDATGVLAYKSSKTGQVFKGQATVNDGAWHTVAFTHYVAVAKTILYVDAVAQIDVSGDDIHSQGFVFGRPTGTDTVDLRNLLFYRAGMTQVEMSAIQSGSFLQSSMEIYAPLDGQGKDLTAAVVNLAQSTNELTASGAEAGGTSSGGASNVGGAVNAGGTSSAGAASVAGAAGGGASSTVGGAPATAGSANASAGATVNGAAGASSSPPASDNGCSCGLPGAQRSPAGSALAAGALLALAGIFVRSRRARSASR